MTPRADPGTIAAKSTREMEAAPVIYSSQHGRRVVAGLVACVALVGVPAAALAEGSDPNGKATFDGPIKTKGKTATLKVTYRCASGEALWVSAKQVKSTKKDSALKKEGSSKTAKAWLESHRNKFVCDGKSQTATFSIDTVEKGSKGKLKPGYAWVQFCVTKGEQDLILSESGWVKVKKA